MGTVEEQAWEVASPDYPTGEPVEVNPRAYAAKEHLWAEDEGPAEDDVEVRPGVWVKVRALSRAEMLLLRKRDGVAETEQLMVSLAMVAPRMSEREVALWQNKSGFYELEQVTRAIARLSGMEDRAEKAAYKSS